MTRKELKRLCDDGEILCSECSFTDDCPMEDDLEREKEETARRAEIFRGEEAVDLKLRAKKWAKRIRDIESPSEFFGHKLADDELAAYFKALGFLTKHGTLVEKVPVKDSMVFEERYRQIKGTEHEGLRYDVCTQTWAISMSIHFKEEVFKRLDDYLFPKRPKINGDNNLAIYHTEWCWKLLETGFGIRSMNDVETIECSIPKEFLPAFKEGYSK